MNKSNYNTPWSIGFESMDSIFEDLMGFQGNTSGYPPYNLIKYGDYAYGLEIAVAGFEKDEISLSIEDKVLTVSGSKQKDKPDYIHQGISFRNFTRKFVIESDLNIKAVEFIDGMLKIGFEHIIPEEKKPKNIPIGYKDGDTLELLKVPEKSDGQELLLESGILKDTDRPERIPRDTGTTFPSDVI